jgi:ferredoxin
MQQKDIDRIQEFRKCIECFLCQDVCHVLRDHRKEAFAGPRFLIHLATLDMHPLDTLDRRSLIKDEFKIGYCNITKCCTEVCPENIHITDNAIIPLKERIADDSYDPVRWVLRKLSGGGTRDKARLPVLQPGFAPAEGHKTLAATPTAKRQDGRPAGLDRAQGPGLRGNASETGGPDRPSASPARDGDVDAK